MSPNRVVDATTMFAVPLKDTPLMVRAVVRLAALPVVFWLRVGISPETIARHDGAPLPLVGPAKNKFCEVDVRPVPPCAIASGLVRLSVPIHAVVDVKSVEVAFVNCCKPVQLFAFARLSEIVPLVVKVPPESPLPAVTDVTVPEPLAIPRDDVAVRV